jgi:hypothetical protein
MKKLTDRMIAILKNIKIGFSQNNFFTFLQLLLFSD